VGTHRRLAGVEVLGREVVVEGRRIRFEVAGQGEPVVMVHGLSGSTRWWDRTVPALAARYRVYLVDLPGFGSMRRAEGGFVLSEAAGWLSSWMEAVGLERAHLVGHSMGGYISLMLAARRPDLLRRLVLVAPAGVPTGRSMHGYLLPLIRASRYMTPGFLSVLVRDALRTGPLTLLGATRELLAEDVRKYLRGIEAPTLLIWGGRDTLVPPSVGGVMREEIPDSRLLVIDGAGHVPMFERAAETNAALLAFLAGEEIGE
jgi:pimeloyl-ACP methyl ester carboxylesterase